MLGDTERKVLRIVANLFLSRGQPPSIREIAIKSGRSPVAVREALRGLNDKGFILWSPERHRSMQIIKAWEEEPRPSTKKWWEYD